jgi:hypothetical protein
MDNFKPQRELAKMLGFKVRATGCGQQTYRVLDEQGNVEQGGFESRADAYRWVIDYAGAK